MAESDTSGVRLFPETTWSVIAYFRAPTEALRRQGLELLCERYWRPVHSFFHAVRGRSGEDAKDLTQAFFLWIMERPVLEKYELSRGRFRPYLKAVLRHFADHQAEALGRLKRGGGLEIQPLPAEARDDPALADPGALEPGELFDRLWIAEATRHAVARVRERLLATGRGDQWRAYEAYDLGPAGVHPTYGSVAARLGLSEGDVRNHLFAVRSRVREELRAELGDTVSSERELDQEWHDLVGS